MELLPAGDKATFNKIRELSNAMYKQLGSSPSINPYSQNQNCEEKQDNISEKNTGNSSLETRTHATTRAQGHSSRSQQINNEVQEEPLELTVQKATSSDKTKQSKKQPKMAPILQQKKLQQGKPSTTKVPSFNGNKRNTKTKNSGKSKSPIKKQKEKNIVPSDITDGRRPRRGAAIAASAAMMAQKVLDKQLSSANVAFSDESSTDEDVEEDEGEVHPSNDTNEQGKYYIKAGFSRSLFGSLSLKNIFEEDNRSFVSPA